MSRCIGLVFCRSEILPVLSSLEYDIYRAYHSSVLSLFLYPFFFFFLKVGFRFLCCSYFCRDNFLLGDTCCRASFSVGCNIVALLQCLV